MSAGDRRWNRLEPQWSLKRSSIMCWCLKLPTESLRSLVKSPSLAEKFYKPQNKLTARHNHSQNLCKTKQKLQSQNLIWLLGWVSHEMPPKLKIKRASAFCGSPGLWFDCTTVTNSMLGVFLNLYCNLLLPLINCGGFKNSTKLLFWRYSILIK